MDHLEDKTNEMPRQMESELTDLGEVSTETRGTPFGGSWDGGWGVRKP
jgi:hypothetical protein